MAAMARPITLAQLRKFSISTGAVFDAGYLVAAFSNDALVKRNPEDMHCYLGTLRGRQWKMLEVSLPITSQALITIPKPCIISISDGGGVRCSTPLGGANEAAICEDTRQEVWGRSALFEVRAIDGRAYAVGTRRAAYRRTAPGIWECIDAGCYDEKNFRVGFQSVHGFSEKEIYAVGRNGEIWQYNGKAWKLRDSGTNVTFHKVLCAADGFVYAVGKRGTIVRGRNERWKGLRDIPDGLEFWSIQDYEDRIFLTADARVALELHKSGTVKPVRFGQCDPPTTAYHLTVADGCLYLFGPKDIRKLDGSAWEEVLTLD